MTGISTPRSTSEPPGWRCLPAELASDLPGSLPGRAAGGETGTPAGDRRNPCPSGRGEVNHEVCHPGCHRRRGDPPAGGLRRMAVSPMTETVHELLAAVDGTSPSF